MNKSYFFVFQRGNRGPTKKHETQQEALDEAKRLAEENPGIDHYVCRCLLEVKYDKNPFRIKQLGKSRDHEYVSVFCYECNGTGKVNITVRPDDVAEISQDVICSNCKGAGKIYRKIAGE